MSVCVSGSGDVSQWLVNSLAFSSSTENTKAGRKEGRKESGEGTKTLKRRKSHRIEMYMQENNAWIMSFIMDLKTVITVTNC